MVSGGEPELSQGPAASRATCVPTSQRWLRAWWVYRPKRLRHEQLSETNGINVADMGTKLVAKGCTLECNATANVTMMRDAAADLNGVCCEAP